MKKATNILKTAVVAICTPVALAFMGFAYVLFTLAVPILNDAARILNNLTNNHAEK